MWNQTRAVARKYGAKASAGIAGFAMMLQQAYAALPTSLSTDAATAKTDGLELFGIVVGVLLIIGLLARAASKVGAK